MTTASSPSTPGCSLSAWT